MAEIDSRRTPWRRLTDPASMLPIYLAIAVVVLGFAMLGIGWYDVARQTDVSQQLPYVMSTGLPGVALVIIGALIINVCVRRQDAAHRERQARLLVDALREFRESQ